ncbi:unnamed protein product [Echinostoma caproni]|uniref:RNA-directed RNA polymerase n=1 Tax=Echinostoma caproni TaxID=27848 RepID=A0A183B803_9TREM|nr:unnamed protein product [Echinostoma caproni]
MRLCNAEFADAQLLDQGISVDNAQAIAIVESNTMFGDEHFVVPLPWKKSVNTGMRKYVSALMRLNGLKRRLINDEALRFRYAQTMKTITEKEYTVSVPEEQLYCGSSALAPAHHAILNPQKTENLRIALDCAVKHKEHSLNDMLYQGSDTTANLVGILLRFRGKRVTVISDMEEMFMRVRVPKTGRVALRFLRWPQGDHLKDPEECQMTAYPFGATSLPFCANFTLKRDSREFSSGYGPLMLKAIEETFYVVDRFASFTTCDGAVRFCEENHGTIGTMWF